VFYSILVISVDVLALGNPRNKVLSSEYRLALPDEKKLVQHRFVRDVGCQQEKARRQSSGTAFHSAHGAALLRQRAFSTVKPTRMSLQ